MKRVLFPALLLIGSSAWAQFKLDNVTYKTVYLEDLCRSLKDHPKHIILDVRSDGEYADTLSRAPALNIGRIKDAVHIDIREFPGRMNELAAYKEEPIYVYCSHSQRSRRVSKMLADSGYTKVININGGLTGYRMALDHLEPCATQMLETANRFNLLAPSQLADEIKKGNSYYIIDLRKDSVFKGISSNEQKNANGRFADAVNIPYEALASSLSSVPKDKKILLADDEGDESPDAANFLIDKGYKDVNVLFGGMENWLETKTKEKNALLKWSTKAPYQVIISDDFDDFMKSNSNVALLDIRTPEEFANTHKDSWRDIGNIKGAHNFPFATLKTDVSGLDISKDAPVVVYSFTNQGQVFESAAILHKAGFKNVNILSGGIFSLRWRGNNIKGKSALKNWVINVPEANQ